MQIRELERELKLKLFSRRGRWLELTPEGAALAPAIRNILTAIRAVEKTAQELDGPVGPLKVGVVPSHALRVVVELMRICNDSYPGLSLEVTEAGSLELERGVLAGELDFAVVARAEDVSSVEAQLAVVPVLVGQLVAIAGPTHLLARSTHLTKADLLGQRLLLYRPGYLVREMVVRLLGNEALGQVIYSSENSETTRRLVLEGIGIGFASYFGFHERSGTESELRLLRIQHAPAIELCCVYLDGRHVPRLICEAIAARLTDRPHNVGNESLGFGSGS